MKFFVVINQMNYIILWNYDIITAEPLLKFNSSNIESLEGLDNKPLQSKKYKL